MQSINKLARTMSQEFNCRPGGLPFPLRALSA